MKNCLIALGTVLLSSLTAFAQVRVGITAGAQLANIVTSDPGGLRRGDNKAGLFGGLVLTAPLSGELSVRSQLLYSMKGTTDDFGGTETSVAVSYLEVPVLLTNGIKAGPGRVLLGIGPYVGYALNGTVTATYAGQTQSKPVAFGQDGDQLRRLDIGLRLSAGYELGAGLSVSAFFSRGLRTIVNDEEIRARNRVFGISLGYLFRSR